VTRAKDDSPNIQRTQVPKTPPGSHEMGPSAAAVCCLQRAHTIHANPGGALALSAFLSLVTLAFDPQIQTRARFLYSALNSQVSSSYV